MISHYFLIRTDIYALLPIDDGIVKSIKRPSLSAPDQSGSDRRSRFTCPPFREGNRRVGRSNLISPIDVIKRLLRRYLPTPLRGWQVGVPRPKDLVGNTV
ncbi:MAG: hypothetical protein IIA61_06330 [Candidatus Marinimicrobia bacterium]|nr:hypothetical protein [Candidatus Neomarinimicrobiota bacterium]